MIGTAARFVRFAVAGMLLLVAAAPLDSAAAAGSTGVPRPKLAPTPDLRAHATTTPQWTTSGPMADDMTALAASPNFDADHTVFAGVSIEINPGQPTVAGVALIERSTDGGSTWSLQWQQQSPAGTTQQTLNQLIVSPNFSADRTVFALQAGAAGGGVLRSTDGGATFQPLNVGTTNFSATTKTLSISPTFGADHTIAVTADSTNTTTSYLSTDGGTTWHAVMPSIGTGLCAVQGGGFLLARGGSSLGSYIPNANLACSNNTDQLYALSNDDGATWQREGDIQAAVGGNNNFDSQHSRMVADGGTILYTDQYGNSVRSANGGTTWSNLLGATLGTDAPPESATPTGPYYTFEFASATSVYAVHEWTKLSPPHIFHSSNGGTTWSVLWQGDGATAQHDVTQAGAHTLFMAAGNLGMLRSSDLGQTWQTVGGLLGLAAAVAPSPNFTNDAKVFTVTGPGNLVWQGQDSAAFGIYRSADSGATWSEGAGPNPVMNSQFCDVFTTSSQGGASMAVSPNFASDETVFEGDRIGAISVSHDGGKTWTMSLPGTPPQCGFYINALAVSPNFAADHVLYWGGGPGGFGLFKSVDSAQSWVQVTPADRINEIAASQVEGLAVSAESSGLLDLAIGMSDKLWLARDNPSSTARQEWFDANLSTVGAVAMSPNYQSDCTIYANMWPGPSGVGETLDDGLYVSHNACPADAQAGMITWTRLTGSLPEREFSTLALSPNFATDRTLFIGSYNSGVFMSNDAGLTWTNLNSGLGSPLPRIYKLAVASTGPQAGILFAASDYGLMQTPVSLTPGSLAHPLTTLSAPQRLVDTRTSGVPIASGSSQCFAIAGQGNVPQNATGVLLNVAAVQYGAAGWLTLYPSGGPVPATSTLNFAPGEYAIANGTIVGIGPDGKVCVNVGTVGNVPGSSHVILDATGYVANGGQTLVPLLAQPQRLVDTRSSSGPILNGGTQCFTIAGQGGIPGDAAGVLLNVAAVGYATQGWLTLYPAGEPVPATSTLNFDPSEYAIANGTIARLGANGKVCVNVGTVGNAVGGAQVILDATGYITANGQTALQLLAQPQRLVDTRSMDGAIPTGGTRCFQVANRDGIPSNAAGVVLNVAAVGYTTPGWLTLFPSGQGVPATSSLNFDTGEYAIATGTVARIGPDGQLCVNVGTVGGAAGGSQVILDVVGFLTP